MAGKDDNRSPSIKKLSGDDNWPIWKQHMRIHFVAADLWPLIDESEPEPALPTPLGANPTEAQTNAHNHAQKKKKDWTLRRARVIRDLYQTVEDKHLLLIMQPELETPKQVWDTLVNNFDRPSLSNKLSLIQKLLHLKQGEKSVEKYFTEFMDVQTRLANLKWTIQPEMVVSVILAGLAPQYEMLRTAIITKGEATVAELFEALRDAERRLGSSEFDNSAMRVSGGQQNSFQSTGSSYANSNRGGGKKKGSGRKWNNRGGGGNRNSGEASSFPEGSCYQCGKFGHFKSGCPKLQHNSMLDEGKGGDKDASSFCALFGAELSGMNFIINSGATAHMVADSSLLYDVTEFPVPQKVTLGDGHSCSAVGEGKLKLICNTDGKDHPVDVDNVLLVPKLAGNFISVNAATKKGNSFMFQENGTVIRDAKNSVIAVGSWENKTPVLKCRVEKLTTGEKLSALEKGKNDLELWHQRLGHCGVDRMEQLVKKQLANGVKGCFDFTAPKKTCLGCVDGKSKQKPYPKKAECRSTGVLDLIHSDVCGPMSAESFSGSKYYVTFIDDYSRYCTVYFLKRKSDVFEKFQDFKAEVETKFTKKIKTLRSDNGGEYCSGMFDSFLKKNGI
jgi:hypothetical protein